MKLSQASSASTSMVKASPFPMPEEWWRGIFGAQNLVILGDSNFHEFISRYTHVMVFFYAPWCSFCADARSAWAKAAHTLARFKHSSKFAAVDVTREVKLAAMYDVKEVPVIKLFRNGQAFGEYTGERTGDEIVAYLLAITNCG